MDEIEPHWIRWPYARIRRELRTESGEIVRFVVQLEYDVEAEVSLGAGPSWRVVARFDHDNTDSGGHDVSVEGLHLDVYRDGERYDRLWDFPTLPPGTAMRYCETYLRDWSDRFLARFERWHGIRGPWSRS